MIPLAEDGMEGLEGKVLLESKSMKGIIVKNKNLYIPVSFTAHEGASCGVARLLGLRTMRGIL